VGVASTAARSTVRPSTGAARDDTIAAMDETIADRYRRRARLFTDTVAAVAPDRWSSPSPCEDWNARQVLAHVVESQGMFERLVGREPVTVPPVEDDPLGAWETARDQVQADLDDPGAAGVEFDGYFGRTTFAEAVDRFLSFDLVVHRWDLARAAGLPDEIPPDDVAAVQAAAEAMGDALRSPGAAGPPLDPPPGADAQTRLLAFLGRRAW
jgi:uncharacterized protein (TIGR03086 family)